MKAMLSQGEPRYAAVNFNMYQSLQWHRMVFTVTNTCMHVGTIQLQNSQQYKSENQ